MSLALSLSPPLTFSVWTPPPSGCKLSRASGGRGFAIIRLLTSPPRVESIEKSFKQLRSEDELWLIKTATAGKVPKITDIVSCSSRSALNYYETGVGCWFHRPRGLSGLVLESDDVSLKLRYVRDSFLSKVFPNVKVHGGSGGKNFYF